MQVFKLTQDKFEQLDYYNSKGCFIRCIQDLSYSWVTNLENADNLNYSEEARNLLKSCEVIEYKPLIIPKEDKQLMRIAEGLELTPMERANAISQEIYRIQRPESYYGLNDLSFDIYEDSEGVWLEIFNAKIQKHSQYDLTRLALLLTATSPAEEVEALVNYVATVDVFNFYDVLPSDVDLKPLP